MELSQIVVTILGAAAVVWVAWFFWLSEKKRVAAEVRGRRQEVKILVKGGYQPDLIVVKKGVPVRLDFYRDETASCSEVVVFEKLGITRRLPPFQTTAIEFVPQEEGEYTFTCGMAMLRGKLIVEP